jgi:hypothetical protein
VHCLRVSRKYLFVPCLSKFYLRQPRLVLYLHVAHFSLLPFDFLDWSVAFVASLTLHSLQSLAALYSLCDVRPLQAAMGPAVAFDTPLMRCIFLSRSLKVSVPCSSPLTALIHFSDLRSGTVPTGQPV